MTCYLQQEMEQSGAYEPTDKDKAEPGQGEVGNDSDIEVC